LGDMEYGNHRTTDSEVSRRSTVGGELHQVLMLAVSLSILQMGFGIVTPIFPYYVISLGVGGIELGILTASFAVAQILFAGPFGHMSDRVGRKPVLAFSLTGFAAANVIYAFAGDVVVMTVARFAEGAVSAGFFPAANAFVADVTTPTNRGKAMGYLGIGNMVGFIVGPTVGGVLAEFLGIRLPFIITAMLALVTLVALQTLVAEPETRFRHPEGSSDRLPVMQILSLRPKAYAALGLSVFANVFAVGILQVAFVLDAVSRFNVTPLTIGVFFGVIGLIMVVGNIGFGMISDRVGRKWLIVLGSLLGALSLFMFMIGWDIISFVEAGIVLGLAISMRGPTTQAMIADLTDKRVYGSVMGVFGAVSNSGYVVAPLLGGFLYETSGVATESLALGCIVSLIGALCGAALLPDKVIRQGSETEEGSQGEGRLDSSIN